MLQGPAVPGVNRIEDTQLSVSRAPDPLTGQSGVLGPALEGGAGGLVRVCCPRRKRWRVVVLDPGDGGQGGKVR